MVIETLSLDVYICSCVHEVSFRLIINLVITLYNFKYSSCKQDQEAF